MLGFQPISAAPISARRVTGAAAASSDLSPYAGSKPGQLASRVARVTGRSWVDLDAAVAASSDLSPYAQGLASRGNTRVLSAASRVWVDVDSAVVASSDLSPYAQARTIEAWRRARSSGAVWNSGDDLRVRRRYGRRGGRCRRGRRWRLWQWWGWGWGRRNRGCRQRGR